VKQDAAQPRSRPQQRLGNRIRRSNIEQLLWPVQHLLGSTRDGVRLPVVEKLGRVDGAAVAGRDGLGTQGRVHARDRIR
jgi:hypothetical protein